MMARLTRGVPRVALPLLATFSLIAASCAPSSAPREPTGAASAGEPQVRAAAPQAPKILTWAILQEPTEVLALSGLGGTRGPTSAFRHLAHAQLVKDDYTNAPFAELAQELPSVEKGTWKLNSDGTMETIWNLRPNVKWHDGTPFTSADLVFWITVLKDDAIPSTSLLGIKEISAVSAPDPQTFVVNWSKPHYRADRIPEYGPIPKHILESVYAQKDPEALLNHRYFTSEYVGLGPYKLASWEPGSRIELTRFDDYFQGRPPLDRVVLQFIPDFNTMVSNVMAGTVDVASPPANSMETMMDLKRRWEGTGNRVRTDPGDRIHLIYPQYRPEYAQPTDALLNRTVRQALYYAIDRPAFAEVIMEGLAPPADSWIPPSHPLRKDLESAIPQYPYDPGRAQQLLTEAGWVRGGDGILVNQRSGERFELDLRNRPGSATERELLVIGDYWKAAGLATSITPPSPNLVTNREWLATYPGVQVSRLATEDAFNTRRLHTRAIAAPANRWAGRNGAAYSNPTADRIQEQLIVTIERPQQIALHRQLLQEVMGDVGVMPLFWDIELALATKTVKGDVSAVNSGWNVFTWDKE